MTRNGETILNHPLGGTVRTGIEYEALVPGLVPEIEEREAARFNGYTWRDWLELERHERAAGIGHSRLTHLIALHQHDALREDERLRALMRRSNGA